MQEAKAYDRERVRTAEIRRLDPTVVNRIAAGEVIERPASVIKELIENAIDADADRIEIVTGRGGKTLMRVTDNGMGMDRDNLAMAIERHCTSKLGSDLMDIRNLGFRGEALPSIGSVARLSITSRAAGAEDAWRVCVDGGTVGPIEPAALSTGTVVEVSNLFYATPARLKFLKSDQAEANAITEVFKRTALAFPQIRFSIDGDDRSPLDYPATTHRGRMEQVLGAEFGANAMEIDAIREGVSLTGLASVPTYHRGNAMAQYFYVNGRPVRDKALIGAVRGAYMDFLPKGRHPSMVLFIELDPHLVDVNVHPAKAEVRFRDPGLVRGLIVGALKQAISLNGPLTDRAGSEAMAAAFRTDQVASGGAWTAASFPGTNKPVAPGWQRPLGAEPAAGGFAERQTPYMLNDAPSGTISTADAGLEKETGHRLGAARAQLHKNYIVAQTQTGLIIVDQHAAHERIVYEKLKQGFRSGMASQLLLVPEIVDLPEEDVNRLGCAAEAFARLGLELEAFGPGAVAVRGTPALLGETDVTGLVRDLAAEMAEWDDGSGLERRLEVIAATMACHGSVRSGRILKPQEMNALLREMEATPNSGQCNHGRPTFIELELKDIERLFGR